MLLFVEILQNLLFMIAIPTGAFCIGCLFMDGLHKREYPPYTRDSEDEAFFDDDEIDTFDVFDDAEQEDKSDDHTR